MRRGKARNSRGRANPTRQLSFQPVAAEGGMEVMKCLKHLGVKGPDSGSASEQAVMQMNTEEVPKPSNVDADPAWTWGRLPSNTNRTKHAIFESTGALVTACLQEEFRGNTGSPVWSLKRSGNVPPARAGQGWTGSRRGPWYRGNRVMPVEGRGLSSRATQEEAKARRLA